MLCKCFEVALSEDGQDMFPISTSISDEIRFPEVTSSRDDARGEIGQQKRIGYG